MKKLILAITAFVLMGLYLYSRREVPITTVYSGDEAPAEPAVTIDSIGHPRFATSEDVEVFAGTAFLLEHRLGPIMVGTYHTLKNADDLQAGVEATLRSKVGTLAIPRLRPLKIPHQGNSSYSQPAEKCSAEGDLAAFFVHDLDRKAKVLKLARVDAKIGEPVWIVEVRGAAKSPTGAALVLGHVHYHSNKVLVIKMGQRTGVQGTSGAPVVNAAGEVVGVNVGYSEGAEGYMRIAVPGETLREVVKN